MKTAAKQVLFLRMQTTAKHGHFQCMVTSKKKKGIGISYNKRKVLTILQEQIWVLSFVHTKRDNKNECEEDKWLLLN
jgi:hypothetical protein